MVDEFLMCPGFQIHPLLADDSPGGGTVRVIDFEVDLRHLELGVPLVAEPQEPFPVGLGDTAERIAPEAILLVLVPRDGQEEPGMPLNVVVVAKLDEEIAIAVPKVVQTVVVQEGFDHCVTEWFDVSHVWTPLLRAVAEAGGA